MQLMKKTFVKSSLPQSGQTLDYSVSTAPVKNTIFGSNAMDNIFGGSGRDTIRGGGGDDVIFGYGDNDTLYGEAGDDTLNGGEGDDWIIGGAGDDKLTGGAGSDTFSFQVGGSNATVNFGRDIGSDVVKDFDATTDRIDLSSIFARFDDADVEGIIASLEAVAAPNVAKRKTGTAEGEEKSVDTRKFQGLNGDKYMFQVSATTERDGVKSVKLYMVNESNPDDDGATITFSNIGSLSGVTFLRDQTKLALGTIGDDIQDFSSISGTKGIKAYGLAGDDTITGSKNADMIYGDAGNDTLYGGNGKDNLYGGGGADNLYGDAGDDYLYGGTNGGTYAGSASADHLYGGAGKDTFIFGAKVVLDATTGDATLVFDKGFTVVEDFQLGIDSIKFADMTGFGGDMKSASLDYGIDETVLRSLLTKQGDHLQLRDGNSGYLIKNVLCGLTDTNNDGKITVDDITSTMLHQIFVF